MLGRWGQAQQPFKDLNVNFYGDAALPFLYSSCTLVLTHSELSTASFCVYCVDFQRLPALLDGRNRLQDLNACQPLDEDRGLLDGIIVPDWAAARRRSDPRCA